MALAKHHEEILLRRRENGAAIVDEFLHPQENARGSERAERLPGVASHTLGMFDALMLRKFVIKLGAHPERVSRELLLQTYDWTPAHFNELARKWPKALARVAMALRDRVTSRSRPEAPFRAIKQQAKPFVVEIKRRQTLHLPSYYADCYQ